MGFREALHEERIVAAAFYRDICQVSVFLSDGPGRNRNRRSPPGGSIPGFCESGKADTVVFCLSELDVGCLYAKKHRQGRW